MGKTGQHGRCETCQHWNSKRLAQPEGWGFCNKETLDESKLDRFAALGSLVGAHEMTVTGAKFGCIHYEGRQEASDEV